MTNSNILEKVKILSVAAEYAEKAGRTVRVWNLIKTNVYLPFEKRDQSYT